MTRRQLTGALALGLLSLPLLGKMWNQFVPPSPPVLPSWLLPLPPRSPSERAWREAYGSWARARDTAAQEIERLAEWDPTAEEGRRRQDLLRRLMAGDHTGDLQRARRAAIRAVRLARTPRETSDARMLLALIEPGLGHRGQERERAGSHAPGASRPDARSSDAESRPESAALFSGSPDRPRAPKPLRGGMASGFR